MKKRNAILLLGIGVGVAVPLIGRAVRPLAAYAVAGGMIAYEAICDVLDSSTEVLSASLERVAKRLTDTTRS